LTTAWKLFKEDRTLVAHLCNRRFGIGGDGLILLENDPESDFKMVYYNSDGSQSTMCETEEDVWWLSKN
jgi:diaminopimelate epimerase